MARKKIARKIVAYPKDKMYSPSGCEDKEVISVMIEELEAMRLKDVEELNQSEAAQRMGVSRQTFQNIIDSGRKKVARALFDGITIEIVGGNHVLSECSMRCGVCGELYDVEFIDDKHICPECGAGEVKCVARETSCKEWCVEK